MITAEPTIAIQTIEPVPEILVPQGEVHEIRGVNHWAVPGTPACDRYDQLEVMLLRMPQAKIKLVHRFTPGLYIREWQCPAGTMVTTRIHLTEHPFIISKGRGKVWTDNGGCEPYEAPYCGITKPGTRRILFCETETIWTTFHVTNLTDPEEIENLVTMKHDDHYKSVGLCPDLSGAVNNPKDLSP